MTEAHQKQINDILEILKRLQIYAQQMHSFQDYAADIYIRRGLEREFALLKTPLGLLISEENGVDLRHSKRVYRLLDDIAALDDTVVYDLVKRFLVGMEGEMEVLLD
jgi:hypothetical protein